LKNGGQISTQVRALQIKSTEKKSRKNTQKSRFGFPFFLLSANPKTGYPPQLFQVSVTQTSQGDNARRRPSKLLLRKSKR
jgi:isopenicillin N synthase-like dioxygenase